MGRLFYRVRRRSVFAEIYRFDASWSINPFRMFRRRGATLLEASQTPPLRGSDGLVESLRYRLESLAVRPLTICLHHVSYGLRDFPQFDGVLVFPPGVQTAGQGAHPGNTSLMQEKRRPGAGGFIGSVAV